MYREKPIPPFFLLITIFLACVAVVPPGGAAVMQEDPGFITTMTPPGGYGMPEFCTMVPGDTVVPCDPAAQNVLSGSTDTFGGVVQECRGYCPLMTACPDGNAGFCTEQPVTPGTATPNGFAGTRQLANPGSSFGGPSLAGTPTDQPVRTTVTQGLQFTGVSATAPDFSEVSSAEAATGGFAYPEYRGSGSRASVSTPRAHYSCRF